MYKFLVFLIPALLLADQTLDNEINALQKEIQELRIRALNDQERAQENLRYQGHTTVREVESVESLQQTAESKQKELDLLLQKRNELSK